MKIGMLVGACGLALAGTAMAGAKSATTSPRLERIENPSLRVSAQDMAEYRAFRTETPNSPAARSLASASARGLTFAYRDTLDGFDADQMPPQDANGNYIRAQGLVNPADYEDPFDLAGQFNPDGDQWGGAVVAWSGIVDNSTALSNAANYNGPAGGPDPLNERGGMLHVQGASVDRDEVGLGFGTRHAEHFSRLYTGTSAEPMFIQFDCYKPTHQEFQWFSPISFTEGFFLTQVLMGGYNDAGTFLTLSQKRGDPNLIEGAVFLAERVGDPNAGQFVLSGKDIPEGGWFTMGILIDPVNFMAIFVQDSDTLADADMNGEPDWQMPQNPTTMMRMFEEYGYGLEMGWASMLPGTEDDPMTANVIEGAGFAINADDEQTVTFSFNGNLVHPILAAVSFDAGRFLHGSDVPVATLPSYEIRDWWWDDIRVTGTLFPQPDPIPTYNIPYIDDAERWSPGRLSLQGGRWGESTVARVEVVTNQNNTTAPGTGAGGMPTQSFSLQNREQDDNFREEFNSNLPTQPRVRALTGDPLVARSDLRFQSQDVTYSFQIQDSSQAPSDTVEYIGRLFTSGTDDNLIGDGQVYVRQRKDIGTDVAMGEFDVTLPVEPLLGPHLDPTQEFGVNTEFVNVEANPAGQSSFSLNVNTWHRIQFEAEPGSGTPADNGEEHNVRIFANGTELFPNGNAMESWTTRALSADQAEYGSGNNFFAGTVRLWVDNLVFEGPTQTDTQVGPNGMLVDPAFSDDSPWTLDFSDSLDTYEKGRPATPQGFANYRVGFLPIQDPDLPAQSDFTEIEFIDGADALMAGEEVVVYEVTSIDTGAPGFMVGDIVAARLAGVPSEFNPDDNLYGSSDPMADPTKWYVIDSLGGSEIFRGTWRLATATGVTTFDPMVHEDLGAGFSYRLNFRYTGSAAQSEFVSAADEGIDFARGSRGDIVRMVVDTNSNDNSDPNGGLRGNEVVMFAGLFPVAQTTMGNEDSIATLSADLYVGQAGFETGAYVTFAGGTSDGGVITGLSLGGKGLQSGNLTGGVVPFLPTGNFGVLVANPAPGAGNPTEIWQNTGVAVPTLQWFTVEATVNGNSEWTVSIDGTEIASGVAADAGNPALNTTSFDGLTFVRNQFGDNDGAPTLGEITWSARAFDAPAPFGGGVGPYHFYELDEVFTVGTLPQIWPVNPTTGVPTTDMMGAPTTRALASNDTVIMINNDPMTMAPLDAQLLNFRWELVDGMAATLATGNWTVLGLPGAAGVTNPSPAGDISAGTVPYNNSAPFETAVLGDYVNIEFTSVFPADRWYADNFALTVVNPIPCPADLDGNGSVGAGDLGILLAAWGTAGPGNLDGLGVVGSGDLAILFAAWGPCPM